MRKAVARCGVPVRDLTLELEKERRIGGMDVGAQAGEPLLTCLPLSECIEMFS